MMLTEPNNLNVQVKEVIVSFFILMVQGEATRQVQIVSSPCFYDLWMLWDSSGQGIAGS